MTYTVKPGDTLSKIAMRNGVTLPQLLQANPKISDPNKIKVGDVINLPNGSTADPKPLPLSTRSRFPLSSPLPLLAPQRRIGSSPGGCSGSAVSKI